MDFLNLLKQYETFPYSPLRKCIEHFELLKLCTVSPTEFLVSPQHLSNIFVIGKNLFIGKNHSLFPPGKFGTLI